MENNRLVVSAFYHTTGPVLSISYRNEYEIFFVEEGEIELTVGSKTYTAGKNSLTLLANLEQQGLRLKKNTHCSRYCVFLGAQTTDTYIRNPELLDLLKNHSDGFCHCVDMTPVRDEVLDIIRKMQHCREDVPYANDLASAYLTQLLVMVSRLHPQLKNSSMSEAYKNRIYAVQRYIDEHFSEDMTVADLGRTIFRCIICHISLKR